MGLNISKAKLQETWLNNNLRTLIRPNSEEQIYPLSLWNGTF